MNGDGGEAQINKTIGQVCIHLVDSEIEPYSALGGVLAVQDEIKVTFDLIANKAL